jgi:hypothetical protein
MNGGLLKTTPGDFPPKNIYGLYVENNAHVVQDTELYFFGDVRGNENPGTNKFTLKFSPPTGKK